MYWLYKKHHWHPSDFFNMDFGEKTVIEAFVRQEIRQQLHTASRVSIDVKSCDMVSGVISVRVTEDFVLPGGFHKSIACDKTILVETEVIEEETETEEIWPQEEEI